MFCQECGNKRQPDAKFCGNCGKGFDVHNGGGANSRDRNDTSFGEKIFFTHGPLSVSDATFTTYLGASYPIRNITSVSVSAKGPGWLLRVMTVVLLMFGLVALFGISVSLGVILLGLSAICLYALSTTTYQLRIGAGGVLQTAIESHDSQQLHGIAKAINEAIVYLQRGRSE